MVQLAEADPDFIYANQEIVDENGVSHYQGECSYLGADVRFPNVGRPCIVGQALSDLGFSRDDLSTLEGKNARVALPIICGVSDSKAFSDIVYAQVRQDNGDSWQEAVKFPITNPKTYCYVDSL